MIHVGQCGNQIGNQFWSLLLQEHEQTQDTDEALSAFFHFSPQRDGTKAMKARALLVDMECGPLQETMRGPLGSLFDEKQFVMDVYGAGNNFAHGFAEYGPKYKESFLEGIRRIVESCESLQTFFITHSLGGGTGSGVGSFMFSLLEDHYPRIYRFSNCVYPSPDADVVTSPYNSILSSSELLQHADCVFPVHNHCLQSFAVLERDLTAKQSQRTARSAYKSPAEIAAETEKALQLKAKNERGFDAMNKVIARMLCQLTASARFNGNMNVDLNEIYTNLIPFRRINFLSTALSLQRSPSGIPHQSGSRYASLDVSAALHRGVLGPLSSSSSSSVNGRSPASGTGARSTMQRAFTDVLTRPGQLCGVEPSATDVLTLASAFITRGTGALSDLLHCVNGAQRALLFPEWNSDACKIGMCGTPGPGEGLSVLGIYNSTGFGTVLETERSRFQTLFK